MSDYNDLELQEQLMNQLEEMQTEIDQYKLIIADLQSEVSKKDSQLSEVLDQTSSEVCQLNEAISELRKDNQQKSETIKSLNDQIGKLAESDIVLKQNDELKKLNEQLQKDRRNTEKAARTVVSAVKKEYGEKVRKLADTQITADRELRNAQNILKSRKEQISSEAKEMYESRRKSLESAYSAKTAGYEGFLIGCLLYGILCTVFTAIRSERFVSDFKAFFDSIWTFLCMAAETLLEGAIWASQLGDKIPQPIIAGTVHWIILIAVVMLGGGYGFFLLIIGLRICCWYVKEYADTISLAVLLISLAVAVFFAEPIRAVLPINLLLLLILLHALHVGVRCYIKRRHRNRGYY